METNLEIKPIHNDYKEKILGLILPIQKIEFNVPVTLEEQPDLLDVDKYYYRQGGGFWGAEIDGELIGTIALIATGHNAGAIRKMFVKKEYRGKEHGVAKQLLDKLIHFCTLHKIDSLYLGTVDILKAAHRFYEKNGFKRQKSEEMPDFFPRMMGENVYYRLFLAEI
jgi:GNAT superfamily N-acetyltransferase